RCARKSLLGAEMRQPGNLPGRHRQLQLTKATYQLLSTSVLRFRQAQHYAVHIILNDKLAGKAAVIPACTGELKHVGLAFFRLWYRVHPGLVNECMAGCATAGTAAISLDAGNHGIYGGLHHGLAHFTDDGVLSAV